MSATISKPVLGLALLAVIIAAASLTEVFVVTQQLSEQGKKVDELSSQLGALSTQFSAKPETGTRTVYMIVIADMGGDGYDKFLPQTVTVLKGDTVKIVLNNTDLGMDHGFAIDAYGISQVVKAGQTITIEFLADKPGVFTFYCTIPCGPGHSEMTGQLIVLG